MKKHHVKYIEVLNYKFGVKLLLIIAFWEAMIMLGLSHFGSFSPVIEVIIDTSVLTILSGVSIWFFILLPLRKVANDNLSSSVSLMGQELDAIHQIAMVSASNLNGDIIYGNDIFFSASGYTREELLMKNHNVFKSGIHSKEFYDQMWATLKEGKIWHGEICNKKKNGDLFWVDTYIFSIMDSDGRIVKYVSFRFDITSEKLLEENLEKQRIKAIHLDRLSAIGGMSAGVAHEINNPLTIVSGLITGVERKIQSPSFSQDLPKILDNINKVQFQILRISKIVNGLREFSRSGENEPFEMVSCQKIGDMVGFLFSEKLKHSGIRFEIIAPEFEFQCNHIQIEQVLVNLVGNSVDAISRLDDQWIKLEFLRTENFVEISVTDSGRGIDKNVVVKMMEPFFTTKEVGKGTGLGLSISRGIVEKHGGIMYVDTESVNTRLVIQIPLYEDSLFSLIDIDDAIKSHMSWRNTLLNQFSNPDKELSYEFVSSDCNCAVGKWLLRIGPRFSSNSNFQDLKRVHAQFHKCAGEIVRMAQNGDEVTSELILGSGTEFDRLSHDVVSSLKSFRSHIPSSKKSA